MPVIAHCKTSTIVLALAGLAKARHLIAVTAQHYAAWQHSHKYELVTLWCLLTCWQSFLVKRWGLPTL